MAPITDRQLIDRFTPVDGDLIISSQGGRHRPQRCRQTDQTAGEAVVYVQAASSGTAKGHRGRPCAAYQLPVHQEGLQSTFPMKPISLVFLAALFSTIYVFSQDEETADLHEATTARILGDLPDGSSPPAEPAKPPYIVPAADILRTETHQQGGRHITIQQINPIELPLPPRANVPLPGVANAGASQTTAEDAASVSTAGFSFVGATVFHPQDSTPRTFVNFSPQGQVATVSFWSTADFAYLSGFSSFIGTDGIDRSLIMTWDRQEIGSLSDLMTGSGASDLGIPVMPPLQTGAATFAIISGQPSQEIITAIRSLHDLYNNEYDRLKTAYEGRERARIAEEAELKAHPPAPKDLVIRYWDIQAAPSDARLTPAEGAGQ